MHRHDQPMLGNSQGGVGVWVLGGNNNVEV